MPTDDIPTYDVSKFASLEDALKAAQPGRRYIEVGRVLQGGGPITVLHVFFLSMISRSEGLHGAIVREIKVGNPHAVFPLIRAFTEAVTLVAYVIEHPRYVDALIRRPSELPKDGPKRKSMQSLIAHVAKDARGLKGLYAELSEATHFGAVAMWSPHTIEHEDDDATARTSWSSAPRWRNEKQAMLACSQVIELADAMEFYLQRLGKLLLVTTAIWGDTEGDTP